MTCQYCSKEYEINTGFNLTIRNERNDKIEFYKEYCSASCLTADYQDSCF